jgi:tetratricopeptide (TPR) repeat protein
MYGRNHWLRRLSATVLLCQVVFAGAALPRGRSIQTGPRVTQPSLPDVGQQQLQQLLDEQHSAIQSGDNDAVIAATQRLAATALAQLANLTLLQGDQAQAIALYKQALTLNSSETGRVDLAVALFRAHQNVGAMAEVEQVIANDSGNARAWQLKGSLQMAADDYRGAVVSLARSLDLQADVNAQYALGFSLLKIHEKQKARTVFRQILENYSDKAIWHVIFGGAYRDTDYLEDAIVEFKKAAAMDPKVGHSLFFLGLTYLQQNAWAPDDNSLTSFQKAIQVEPRSYLVNFYLGALESTQKQFAESNAHLHLASEIEPKSPEVWLYLGLNAYAQQKTLEAKRYLTKAIEATGTDEERNNYQIRRAYYTLGRIAIQEGDREQGDKLLARVKQLQQKTLANSAGTIKATMKEEGIGSAPGVVPEMPRSAAPGSIDGVQLPGEAAFGSAPSDKQAVPNPVSGPQQRAIRERDRQLRQILASSFNDLGTAAARQHKYAVALTDFHEAEHWDPATPGLKRNLGIAAFKENDTAESAKLLGEVVTTDPSDQKSRLMLAMSLFSLGRFPEAADQFAPVAALAMGDPRTAYAWAFSLARTGQPQQTNKIADQLVSKDLPADVLSLVCHLYTDVENYEHSISCFRKAYQEDPKLQHAHFEIGAALIHLDRPQEAVPELEQELAISPADPNVEYYLGYALLQTDHKPDAQKLFADVLSKKPDDAQAQYQMGKLLLEQGKIVEAIQHLESAERNDPNTDYIHYQLQIAYRKAGRREDAEREVKLYREIKDRHREAVTAPVDPYPTH